MVAETSVLSCGKRTKRQYKRKSILIEYFIKRRRLNKNHKPTTSANKQRNLVAIRHVSDATKSSNGRLEKKKIFRNFVKTDRSVITPPVIELGLKLKVIKKLTEQSECE